MERVDIDGGKYTIINDNGKLTALRHGEPWGRDFTGDKLVYCLMIELHEARRLLADAKHTLQKARIWNGTGWHYNPLHPLHYKPLLDELEGK